MHRSSIEYIGIIIGIIAIVIPMTWWLRASLIVIGTVFFLHLCWRAPWVARFPDAEVVKIYFSLCFVYLVLVLSWNPIRQEYLKSLSETKTEVQLDPAQVPSPTEAKSETSFETESLDQTKSEVARAKPKELTEPEAEEKVVVPNTEKPKVTAPNKDTDVSQRLKELTEKLEANKIKQRAFIRINIPILKYEIGSRMTVMFSCRHTGGIPALQVGCAGGVFIVPTHDGKVSDTIASEKYLEFEPVAQPLLENRDRLPTVEQGMNLSGTARGPTVTEELQTVLETGQLAVLFVGHLVFTDEAGEHRTEACLWRAPPLSNPNSPWHVCGVRNGIRY
jgi:hypothetical protein